MVKDQLTGSITKCHARQLRLADILHWPLSQDIEEGGRTLRKTNYVVLPEEESSSEDDGEVQLEPLERTIRFKQRERENSSDEEDIPLAELQRRIRDKEIMDGRPSKGEHEQTVESESDENPESEQGEYHDQNYEVPLNTPAIPLDEDIEIGEINSKVGLGFTRKPIPKPRKNIAVSKQQHVENYLAIMADVIKAFV